MSSNIPQHLKYTSDHEWIDASGAIAPTGITDYAQGELGDVIFLDITVSINDTVKQGDVLGTIEAVKTVSEILSPVSGRIAEINTQINDLPSIINHDPYERGWIIKIEPSDSAEIEVLMDAKAYQESIGQ